MLNNLLILPLLYKKLGTNHQAYQCRAFLFSFQPKQFPLLGPVFGETFAEFG